MKKHSSIWNWLPGLSCTILFFLIGAYMQIRGVVAIGDWRGIGKLTAVGPALFYLIGTIFLIVTYFSISPFSKFRKFFEGNTSIKDTNHLSNDK